MKTITLLPERDYVLIDNNINIYKTTPLLKERVKKTLIASTANLEGVKQLDRKAFVKKEDVEEFGDSYNNHFQNSIVSIEEDSAFRGGFYAGHNANKAEFSREEMEKMFYAGAVFKEERPYYNISEIKESQEYIDWVINLLRPLSLPKSITVDESYNIIKVNW